MLIQVRGVSVHAMSGIELSRVRTEFRLRLPEPINKSLPSPAHVHDERTITKRTPALIK